jgi:hypothetical protein
VLGESILTMDWAGEPTNDDPATGFGFFGRMNQVNPLGVLPTVFADYNVIMPALGHDPKQDSQFLVNSNSVNVPTGFAQEGREILQAVWGWPVSPGLSVPFAKIAVPNTGQVDYRAMIFVECGESVVGESVSGTLGFPNFPPVAHDAEIRTGAAIISHLFTATDEEPETLTWSNLTNVGVTTPAVAATLSPIGLFTWHTIASARFPFGIPYEWEATVTDAAGLTDVARLTVRLIPEPSAWLLTTIVGGHLLVCRHRSAEIRTFAASKHGR